MVLFNTSVGQRKNELQRSRSIAERCWLTCKSPNSSMESSMETNGDQWFKLSSFAPGASAVLTLASATAVQHLHLGLPAVTCPVHMSSVSMGVDAMAVVLRTAQGHAAICQCPWAKFRGYPFVVFYLMPWQLALGMWLKAKKGWLTWGSEPWVLDPINSFYLACSGHVSRIHVLFLQRGLVRYILVGSWK